MAATTLQSRVGRTAAVTGRGARNPWVLRVGSILLVLALWEWGGTVPVSIAFPKCSETLAAFTAMVADGTFAAAYAETAGPLFVGVLLTGVGGVLAGLVMGSPLAPSGWGCRSSSCCRPHRRRRSSR